jgi:DNA repair protein RadC
MRRRGRSSGSQLPLFGSEGPERDPPDAVPYDVAIYRVALVRESSVQLPATELRDSRAVAAFVCERLEGADREHFIVILLNRKNGVIGINTVSMGSLTASVVHPREVFKPAILANAAAMICAHNHPSGDPFPSNEDRTLTARLVQGGKLLGIDVLDHVIVGDGTERYFSFADAGCLISS